MSAFDRIGLHVIRGGVQPAALATAPVLCLVDCDTAYIREVRAANPGAWIVVRWVAEDQDSYLTDPEAGARRWFREHEADIRATMGPRIVYQGLNEIGNAQAEAFARFEHIRAGLLWGIAAGLGLGAWSVGCPDYPLWALFRLTLQGMDANDAVLIHEYWADPGDFERPWYIGRWKDERVQAHVAGHNIIVTEIGRDRVDFRGAAGWHNTVNAEAFLTEVARYNAVLESDPDVIGACGFTGGVLGEWRDFEWNSLWPRIAATQERGEPVTVEPLPEHETATDAETLAEKCRWWLEEEQRQREAGNEAQANAIHLSLIKLLYRLERTLKGYVDTTTTSDGVGLYWRPPQS